MSHPRAMEEDQPSGTRRVVLKQVVPLYRWRPFGRPLACYFRTLLAVYAVSAGDSVPADLGAGWAEYERIAPELDWCRRA